MENETAFTTSFIRHLLAQYQAHCMHQKRVPGMQHFLVYLIKRELLSPDIVRDFVILEEYQLWQEEARFRNKTTTVEALATAYQIHVSTIWGILRNAQKRFAYAQQAPLHKTYSLSSEEEVAE